ncbi:MAG: DUF4091 domain-containing protein [Fimbriimonadaceae bacterium]|nr:DUF4091 domain-containing protein [Fimbriimonadaceae bacterium]
MTRNPMLRKLRVILVLLLLGAGGWFVFQGTRQSAGRDAPATAAAGLWVVDDSVKLRRDAAPEASSAIWDGQTIKLFGMRNEVLAFQVAIRPAQAASDLTVKIDPPSGAAAKLPADSLRLFRAHFLNVTVPSQLEQDKPAPGRLGVGWYPEQLLPLRAGETLEAQAGELALVWCDLTIPAAAKVGEYTSQVRVAGGGIDTSWDLRLEVLPLTMPRETHLRSYFYYGPERLREYYKTTNDAELAGLEDAFHQMAHDHRATLGTEPQIGDGGFNWTRWWARYGGYLSGKAFTSGPCRGAGATSWNIGLQHDADQEGIAAACRSVVDFFGRQGVLDRIFFGLWDEPSTAEHYAEIRRLGGWVDAAIGQRVPTMVTEQVQPERPEFGTLLSAVDIFCSGQSSDADMALVRQRGGRVWVYNEGLAGGPLIDQALLGVRAWGPCAWRYRLDGWYYWDVLYWRQAHYRVQTPTDLYADPLTFDETRRIRDGKPYPAEMALRLNGDGVWMYPGEPVGIARPVASLRLKGFRRGAQDYEYLWLLRQKGRGQFADECATKLSTGRGTWAEDPVVWNQTRREMADALLGVRG